MTLEKALQIFIGNQEDKKAESFLKFLSDKLWDQYKEHIMDKIKMVNGELKWNLNIPNAKENIEYNQTVSMPTINSDLFSNVELELVDVKGLTKEEHGVKLTIAPDGKSFAITGTPSLEAFRKNGAVAESTFELTLCYKFIGDIEMSEDCPTLEHKIPFVINQDPRKLWKNLPVDWDNMPEPKYKNDDTQVEYVKVEALADGTPQKDIVAASKRGRSHAQEGKPRDDHFRMEHMDNGWYIMAVADGAGSAKFSRQGSKIACDESVSYCMSKLGQSKTFEEAISNYGNLQNVSEEEARKIVGNYIYEIVGTAAFKAHKAIQAESALTKQPIKYYATTLLLTICKKFSFGWFVVSFWVGDGAICLYDRKAHTAKILGVPDEGEYAGQTRFLTMSEIFKDATALYQRLRFYIVDDFTALFLMSDGVSDPKFETDANLNNPDKWDALWDDLKENGVDLTDDNEASKDQLLDWLDFWAPGNHDDRTIAILYEGEDDNLTEKNTTEDQTSEQEPEEQQNEQAMANKITLKAQDGSTVEFYDEIKAQGGVKDVYFSTDKTYVVAFYRKPINANDKARINDIVNVHRNRIFTNDAVGHYWGAFFAWPTNIVEWKGLTGIVMPFYDKKFFFSGVADSWPFIKNGQEKNGKWFSSAKLINRFVPAKQKGSFLDRLHMCLKIARAMRRLHAAGLAHSDLSYNNVLVDPLSGNACIIDCDGLVVPHKFPPEVVGTPGFIAPEVLATKALKIDDPKKNLPKIETDRHALAVLIYTFLLNRHPLDGGKVWDVDDPQKDDDMRYGSKALFIEHPTDKTNKVKVDQLAKSQLPQGDPSKMPYTICGPYLKELFDKAFIDGLHNPSARPTALQWEEALVKTCDLVQPCQNPKCEAHWYVFDNTTKPRCPFCGTEYKGQLPIPTMPPHMASISLRIIV